MSIASHLAKRPASAENIEDIAIERFVGTTGKAAGKPCVRIWKGRAEKPYANYYFESEEGREVRIVGEVLEARIRAKAKAEEAAKNAAWKPNVKVGDIFVYSWGHGQTNIDYAEIVEIVGAKTVMLRWIDADKDYDAMSMTGTSAPRPGCYISAPFKKVAYRGYDDSVTFKGSYGCLRPTPPDKRHGYSCYA